jgi:hypothetical protein
MQLSDWSGWVTITLLEKIPNWENGRWELLDVDSHSAVSLRERRAPASDHHAQQQKSLAFMS